MGQVIAYGVSKIEFGDLANDGGPGTSLTALGLSKEGTVQLTEEDPTSTEFKAEEVDDPVIVVKTRGKRMLKVTLMSSDADTLLKVFGGATTGTTSKVWSAPDTLVIKEQTVKITTRNGSVLMINRGGMTAKFTGSFTKTDLFGIELTIEVLNPTKSGVKSFTVSDPVAA